MNAAAMVRTIVWLRWREAYGRWRRFAAVAAGVWVTISFAGGLTLGLAGGDRTDVAELVVTTATAMWLLWTVGPAVGMAGVDLDADRLAPYPVSRGALGMSRVLGSLLDLPTMTTAPVLVGMCAGAGGLPGAVAAGGLCASAVTAGAAVTVASRRVKAAAVATVAAASVTPAVWGAKIGLPAVHALVAAGNGAWWAAGLLVAATGAAMWWLWTSGPASRNQHAAVGPARFPHAPARAAGWALWVSIVRSVTWRVSLGAALIGVGLWRAGSSGDVDPAEVAVMIAVLAAGTGPLNVFSYAGPGIAFAARAVSPRRLAVMASAAATAAVALPTLIAWVTALVVWRDGGHAWWVQACQVAAGIVAVGGFSGMWSWRHPAPVDHASPRSRTSEAGPAIVFMITGVVAGGAAVSLRPGVGVPILAAAAVVVWLVAVRGADRRVSRVADVLAR